MDLFKDVSVLKINNNNISKENDIVINEKRYSIKINNVEIIDLYCLPINLEELAAGILYQERIISKPDSIISIKIDNRNSIINIQLDKLTDQLKNLIKTRFLTADCINSSLLKGVSDKIPTEQIKTNFMIKLDSVHILLKQFNKMSELYKVTGGTHSAALCINKELLFYNEDIGRHNCIDKLIGWAFLKKINLKDKIIITTGRISALMVIKAVKVAVPILISRSAATWEAVRIAKKFNLALAGFARGSKLNIYTHPERFSL